MTSNDPLIDDARQLLATATASPAVQDYYRRLPLSGIWDWNAGFKEKFLGGSSFEALSELQTHLFVHNPNSRREMELAVRWNLSQPFRAGMREASALSPESSTVLIDKKRYWHDDFRHHATASRIAENFGPDGPKRVVELGAGTGNLARILKTFYPGMQYVIIDLPDTLVYSMMFLRANFPDATWHFVTDPDTSVGGRKEDFIFVPVGMECCLMDNTPFDAFINTASLGEMRHDAVKHWFDFFQNRIKVDYVFSVNRFLNTVTDVEYSWRQFENGHWMLFDQGWEWLDWEVQPDFLRSPYQNRHARQVLAFGKRCDKDRAEVYDIQDALTASWNHPSLTMTAQSPSFGSDLTKTGPLFLLWEAVRANPSHENCRAMLRYMRWFSAGAKIEDEAHLMRAMGN